VSVVKSSTELAAAFRAGGRKVTPQRQLLFGLLDGDPTHPTAEALYARASELMPGISLRTVYTTLTDLADMGELQLLCLEGGAMRFDTNVDHHHHGVCDTCGAVVDLYLDEADDLQPAGTFVARSASIVFRGSCADCVDSSR
jgi:Fur family peroxide stress response transcriptional regulator